MYKFEIYFKIREKKDTGRKFKSFFTTSTKDGHSMSVKFTKEVAEPDRACVMYVKAENARISVKNGYEYLVISGYEKCEKISDKRIQNYFTELSDTEGN